MKNGWILAVYTAAIFVSALLLFSIQPLAAKFLLPKIGGAPQVWNTCMFFFQTALLAGYAYAHFLMQSRRQGFMTGLHLLLMAAACLLLPLQLGTGLPPENGTHPIPWLLQELMKSLGLPFFLLAANSPLLQSWFSRTRHPDAHDPYFLYAASNAGSLAALLSYPFLIEPLFRLAAQGRIWGVGFLIALALTVLAALSARFWASPAQVPASPGTETDAGPGWRLRFGWLFLALVPVSLMYGITTYITTDIAPVPLLWIVPLSLYLVTFILAFSRQADTIYPWIRNLFPVAALPLAFSLMLGTRIPLGLAFSAQFGGFLFLALYCHLELARRRPAAHHLTAFYFWLSLGGVLGGFFSAIAAPLLFNTPLEYPIAIILACIIRMGVSDLRFLFHRWLYYILPLCALLAGLGFGGLKIYQMSSPPAWMLIVFTAAALIILFLFIRSMRFRLVLGVAGIGALLMLPFHQPGYRFTDRSYFGVHRIRDVEDQALRKYTHGNTIHGIQSLRPELQHVPSAYYHPSGPAGQIFELFHMAPPPRRAALIGLGIGNLAAYAREGDHLTFYEIDPLVEQIARDPDLFTFMSRAEGHVNVVLADGRLAVAREAPDTFRFILVDAFSSDSVPAHLITLEALRLYLEKITEDGLLIFHISNRYLDLESVLARAAQELGLLAYSRLDRVPEDDRLHREEGKQTSHWLVMGRPRSAIQFFRQQSAWKPAEARENEAAWTDDFSNILSVLR